MTAKCDKCNVKLRKDTGRSKKQGKLILYCPVCKRNYVAQRAFWHSQVPKEEKVASAIMKKSKEMIHSAKTESEALLNNANIESEKIIKNAYEKAGEITAQNVLKYLKDKNEQSVKLISSVYNDYLDKLEFNVYARVMNAYMYLSDTIKMIEKSEIAVNKTFILNSMQELDKHLLFKEELNDKQYKTPFVIVKSEDDAPQEIADLIQNERNKIKNYVMGLVN